MNEGHALSKTLVGYLLREFLKLDFLGLNFGAFLVVIELCFAEIKPVMVIFKKRN